MKVDWAWRKADEKVDKLEIWDLFWCFNVAVLRVEFMTYELNLIAQHENSEPWQQDGRWVDFYGSNEVCYVIRYRKKDKIDK